MMTIARKRQICLKSISHYHLTGRCVRRAFLCGRDKLSNRNFNHRRQWIVDRLKRLSEVFSIRICSYAIMSNHYHLVIHVDSELTKEWSISEVLERWRQIYQIPEWVEEDLIHPGPNIRKNAHLWVEQRRQRLCSISWFMKSLNEYISRKANQEDQCTGSFWEGRFKSRALLNEQALISCMVYVDLNPIKAGAANTIEDSAFTSIASRIRKSPACLPLIPLYNESLSQKDALPISLADYIQLTKWTGKVICHPSSKAGSQKPDAILNKLGFSQTNWLRSVNLFSNPIYKVIGPIDHAIKMATTMGKHWFSGMKSNANLFKKSDYQ